MTKTRGEPTVLERMGGVSGLVYASVPTVVYAIVNAVAGLTAAVVAAVGVGVGVIVLRRLRAEPIAPAISGLLGVVVAAGIALQTGSAENYFLPGIWMSLAFAVLFVCSIIVRRPLVGVLWNLLMHEGAEPSWRQHKPVLRAFDIATLAFLAIFVARFVVQQWLAAEQFTTWLAVARIAMGYPLLALAVLVSYWAFRRANRWIDGRSPAVSEP